MTSEKARCVKRNMEDMKLEFPTFTQQQLLEKAYSKCKLLKSDMNTLHGPVARAGEFKYTEVRTKDGKLIGYY
ncbi:hypothetical protein LCGC14_0804770 [marine sediment metagenome]|uniref:Uncharacterized protein n=1 Tax=marine sediment metagenome TaxID=412755 RepID=A0A0F9PT29_9ZZZZ